mmetsp:Transcript_5546/g.10025  ORF Transcript_5546/g.10025 Transcript_5546/m.10025 type:complete len:219 (+) Transcript_5546:2742-3398(+)
MRGRLRHKGGPLQHHPREEEGSAPQGVQGALLRPRPREDQRHQGLPLHREQGDRLRQGHVPRLLRPLREVPRPPLRVRPHPRPRRRSVRQPLLHHGAGEGRRSPRGRHQAPRTVRRHGRPVGWPDELRPRGAQGRRLRAPPVLRVPVQPPRRIRLRAPPQALRLARCDEGGVLRGRPRRRSPRQQARLLQVRRHEKRRPTRHRQARKDDALHGQERGA